MNTNIYKTIILFIGVLLFFNSNAQNFRYDVIASNEPYVPLEGAEKITLDEDNWIDIEFTVEPEFGFTVPILGVPSNGLFNLFSADLLLGNGFDEDDENALLPIIFPSSLQFQNRAVIEGNPASSILTLTEGESGNQIFKMEYRNAGFEAEDEINGTLDMFTNQQIWIYEATGCIEYRYGNTSIPNEDILYDGDDGMTAGLFIGTGAQIFSDMFRYFIAVTGDPADPDTAEVEDGTGDDISTLIGHPEEGMVYTFCPEENVSTSNLNNQINWRIFPNPATSSLSLEWNESINGSYTIFGMDGSTIYNGTLSNGKEEVNLSSLPAGFYGVKIQTAEGFAVKRFVKQ